MYSANKSSSAYQLDMYIEKKPDRKAEATKRKAMKIRAGRRKLALYMTVFFVALFTVILRSVMINDLHNDINKNTAKLEELQAENEQTRLKIKSLTDKTKIQQYAEEELGLKKITSAQIIYLNPNRDNCMINVAKANGSGNTADKNTQNDTKVAYSK